MGSSRDFRGTLSMSLPSSDPVAVASAGPRCRFCSRELTHTFVDLGLSPLCQTQIPPERADEAELFFPLRVYVCAGCLLVQLMEYVKPDVIFSSEYPYYSSYSDSWVEHARQYVSHVVQDFGIGGNDLVVELASNDGYLLQHFKERGIKCLGVEPAAGVANAAIAKGIPTENRFFGEKTARDLRRTYGPAKLVLGNNVLAHVPDLNDFVSGVAALIDENGFGTFEFPHLMKLMELNQFDTIYHEHFSYFSFSTVSKVFAAHGLTTFDVRELDTHGGSLRVYVCHEGARAYKRNPRVDDLLRREGEQGYRRLDTYLGFASKVEHTKRSLLKFLIAAKESGKTVVGYGAPGKGNTLLNYCGIRTDFLDYTVDRNPHKQGTYTPGARIPIYDPSK
ncbi:MAG TPA: class I SAM-dependent methyltransferase, partial [Fimbriimonadaceae bacterium]|nr:class I SAM-dependent methyltransferase [Fimbriimonadaceae bacterium]